MSDFFRVLRTEPASGAECFVEVDDYVPLRFRTSERPLGSSYLRLGDQVSSLAEILVDPNIGLVRGITITSFAGLAKWPRFEVETIEQGVPILNVSQGNRNRVDTGVQFSVSVQGSDVLMYWAPMQHCKASVLLDRVRFLTVGDQLAGVVFRGLSDEQSKRFMTHARL